MGRISDAISKHIAELEAQKSELKDKSAKAEGNKNTACSIYATQNNFLKDLNCYKNTIKNKIKALQDKMQAEIRDAIRNNKSTAGIEAYYGKEIAALNSQLEILNINVNKQFGETKIAENSYFNAKIKGYAIDGEFISTCHELGSEYLTKGRLEQQEIVNSYVTKPIDYLG